MEQKRKQATKEAQQQREVRDKKAENNSEVILLTVNQGIELTFHKTKKSSYSKKLYISDEVKYNDTIYKKEDILKKAIEFESVVRQLWIESKQKRLKDLTLTKEMYDEVYEKEEIKTYIEKRIEIVTNDEKVIGCKNLWGDELIVKEIHKPFDFKTEDFLRKRKNKNREAAFSSFLSWILIQEHFTLICRINAQKTTTKTLNYYIWKLYQLPNGKIVQSNLFEQSTNKCRNYLNDAFGENFDLIFNKTKLLEINFSDEELYNLGMKTNNQLEKIMINTNEITQNIRNQEYQQNYQMNQNNYQQIDQNINQNMILMNPMNTYNYQMNQMINDQQYYQQYQPQPYLNDLTQQNFYQMPINMIPQMQPLEQIPQQIPQMNPNQMPIIQPNYEQPRVTQIEIDLPDINDGFILHSLGF